MSKRFFATALLCSAILFSAMAKNDAVSLKIDYNSQAQWRYTVDYVSQANFTQNDSSTMRSSTIHCVLAGVKKDANQFAVKVDSASITSEIYSEETRNKLHAQLLKAEYPLKLRNGAPVIDSTAMEVNFAEWDLLRQLARLLPALPEKPVKPRYTWERTAVVPLQTARGKTDCEIFRYYTFDKLQGDTAVISWKFRYAAQNDSVDALKEIPVSGSGNGTALLDRKRNCILRAEMSFTTPVAAIGDVKVTWHEKAIFELNTGK